MRLFFLSLSTAFFLSGPILAQEARILSATSEPTDIRIKKPERKPEPTTAETVRPESKPETPKTLTFVENFATNRLGWREGDLGDYSYDLAGGKYRIRKRFPKSVQSAYTMIMLPPSFDLNKAESFTIQVDVSSDPGIVPTAGLMFGAKNSQNAYFFLYNEKGEASVRRVLDGRVSPTFMSGKFLPSGVPVNTGNNTIKIRKSQNKLYFYINDKEIVSGSYPFQPFPGNGVGLASYAPWAVFQNLRVEVN